VSGIDSASSEGVKGLGTCGDATRLIGASSQPKQVSERLAAISEAGEQVVVGVNAYRETAQPALAGGSSAVVTVDASAEKDQVERLNVWRATRDPLAVARVLEELRHAAESGQNIMPPSIACAKAGVTTGEWAGALRQSFGEFRAPTGAAPKHTNKSQLQQDLQIIYSRKSSE
jgi:(2R)-ethylmalonyl-CoA mutase